MKNKTIDILAGAILDLFAIWGWYETSTWKESLSSDGISVKVYPRAVFAGLFICGTIILVRTIIKILQSKKQSIDSMEQVVNIYPLKVIATIILMLAYIIGMRAAGFLVATPLFLFLCMLLFGEKRWVRMIIISVVGTAILYLFFVQIMNVRF